MTPDQETNDAIEKLIDSTSLETVLNAVVQVCYEKAAHLRSNWQDEVAAKRWERAAVLIDKAHTRASVLAI